MMFGGSPARRAVKKANKLRTGKTVELTSNEEKLLTSTYAYIQGFAVREQLAQQLEGKREELQALGVVMEKSMLLAAKARQSSVVVGSPTHTKTSSVTAPSYDVHQFEEIQRRKDEYKILEDKYASHTSTDHKISSADIEALLKHLGIQNPQKRVIDQMMWEVDELADDVICWDEFQLAYRRSIDDTTGNEPSSFFRLLEFVSFDNSRKGYIIEDDCMEILFVRYGSSKLEKELKLLFGDSLRSAGGDGTLNLETYLSRWGKRTGRQALLF
jgi:Ca2+-binding EF-hand superfamily protein